MALRINRDRVSTRDWGSVDKSALWARIKRALQEDEEGAIEAVREIYAVLKAEPGPDLTQADCWGPHHEIIGDEIVLNRNGLQAAAAALAGARSEPDLTPEQKRRAREHLRRHYRALDLDMPPALAGEMAYLAASVAGEMAVEDVPLASWARLDLIKEGDPDPLEVVVEVPAGRSKRGWIYEPAALQRIVGEVMRTGLPGFLGHQKPEDVDTQFPTPVTHWVGAKWENGRAYFRGVVDKAAADLKRWIRAGLIRQVSIFGVPKLQQVGGETRVVDYQPLSIDWTPLNRAGMPTSVVAVGEMDTIIGPGEGGATDRSDTGMTLSEILAELRKLGAKPAQVIGEMGWDAKTIVKDVGLKLEDVAPVIAGEQWAALQEAQQAIGEIRAVLGLAADAKTADVVAAAKKAVETATAANKAANQVLVEQVIGEMVAEPARPLVKRMLQVPEGADKAAIQKAVSDLLAQEDVKKAMGEMFREPVISPPQSGNRLENGLQATRVRRASIY